LIRIRKKKDPHADPKYYEYLTSYGQGSAMAKFCVSPTLVLTNGLFM